MDSSNEEFARDMSNKLFEDKDDLILRVVETLGKSATYDLFKGEEILEALFKRVFLQQNLFRERKTNFENLQYIVARPDAPPFQYTAH